MKSRYDDNAPPDLRDLQAVADWLVNVGYRIEKSPPGLAVLTFTQAEGANLSTHAANIRRAIACLKRKE